MATLILEQMLKSAPRFEQQEISETIDLYTTETIALFTPPMGPPQLYGPALIHGGPFDAIRPIEQFGINGPGLGIINTTDYLLPVIERFRDDRDIGIGSHLNNEIYPIGGTKPLINNHLPY